MFFFLSSFIYLFVQQKHCHATAMYARMNRWTVNDVKPDRAVRASVP